MTELETQNTRTYGRRLGRPLTDRQSKLIEEYLPTVSVEIPEGNTPVDPQIFFNAAHPLWMEVGFGGGEHLASLAQKNPNINFIGCEPFINGVVSLLSAIDEMKISNIRIYNGNALDLIQQLPSQSLDRFYLMFADPWPKKRHHKRRFIQTKILDILIPKMKMGSELRLATDHADYQSWMLKHLQNRKDLQEALNTVDKPTDWPDTRYEAKAIEEGRPPLYLIYKVV